MKGGRCESCAGDGLLKIEMHFLPDIYVPCEVCKGKRYNRETLEVKYKGKNIHDVLNMTVDEGLPTPTEFYPPQPSVGLGYLKIGQSSTTLSGGGPSGEAGHGAVPPVHRQDHLYPGRGHHRPAPMTSTSPGGADRLVEGGQHRSGH